MRIQELTPVTGKAILEITASGTADEVRESGLHVIHDKTSRGYQPELDWEMGRVLTLGAGDWDGVQVGDVVMFRAPSGGVGGTDISAQFNKPRGTYVVVEYPEVVCIVES